MKIETYTLPAIALFVFTVSMSFSLLTVVVSDQSLISRIGIQDQRLAASVSSFVLVDDLVVHWSFDEGEGITLLDESGNGHTGIIKGKPSWASGVVGSALNFKKEKDYVEFDESIFLEESDIFTIALWVKPESSYLLPVFSENNRTDNNGGYALSVGDGVVRFGTGNVSALSANNSNIKIGQWAHVTVVYDEARQANTKLYVNGIHVLSGNLLSVRKNEKASVFIGFDGDKKYFNGSIDEIYLYKSALDDSEILEIYNSSF